MQLQSYWERLVTKEKQIVMLGTGLVLLLLSYLFIISPLNNKVGSLQQELSDQVILFQWLDKQVPILVDYQKSSSTIKKQSEQPIILTVEQSLKNNGLYGYVSNFGKGTGGNISLQFKDIAFSTFYQWITQAVTKLPIKIEQIDINKATEKEGLVNVSLVLTAVGKQ